MIILKNGESLNEEEIMEGILLLARNRAAFPLLTSRDKINAVIDLALDALDFDDEQGVLS